ncbi:MAG: response regulator, partial [Bacteroidetes bacterium]|nr:response regulator [Bacteroidota bacterium]
MKLKEARILIVDDDPDVLTALRLLLKNKVKEVVTERNPEQIPALLSAQSFEAVLLDMNFCSPLQTGNEGLFWLRKIREVAPHTALIMITAYGGVELAVRSLKDGAADFIVKPWQNEKLLQTLEEALPHSPHPHSDEVMIGQSKAMHQVYRMIAKVAPTDANILILGENGTGKDLAADAIHRQSLRAGKALIKVDVGAIT